ncbi:MAG: GTP cyclohydrolase FolE2 [Balneolales bacterium]
MITTDLKKYYDPTFTVSDLYKASLPDIQNSKESRIEGANVAIQQVGISNFRMPLSFPKKDGGSLSLETSVDGYVSLEADKKGINMSRLMRSFYKFKDEPFTKEIFEYILKVYRRDLDSKASYLRLAFSWPMLVKSLRSGLEGYQYYDAAIEGQMDQKGHMRRFLHLDFVYSSACPCSFELSEHARETRDTIGIPHSQRSLAHITVEMADDLHVEDLIELCREALVTETQVMVKREDEQAFAEMNGAYQKFVEDAARLLYERLKNDKGIKDFVVRCVHMESLHSHDAVSRISKGVEGGLR